MGSTGGLWASVGGTEENRRFSWLLSLALEEFEYALESWWETLAILRLTSAQLIHCCA
jgi:hypothetical protein